jgi:hypothetical protein
MEVFLPGLRALDRANPGKVEGIGGEGQQI